MPQTTTRRNVSLAPTPAFPRRKRTTPSGVVIAALLGLAPAGTALRPAPLRAALGRPLRLPLAALLRGRLSARGTSLRRHGSTESQDLWVRDNCVFDLPPGGKKQCKNTSESRIHKGTYFFVKRLRTKSNPCHTRTHNTLTKPHRTEQTKPKPFTF